MTFRAQHFALCAAIIVAAALASAQYCAAAPKVPLAAESESKLIAVLQSNAPAAEKAIACKRLAVVGSKDAVPALAPLLLDKDLASWARTALEAIPGPAADDALRESLGKLQGRLLVGAINSIGVRRDTKAVDSLAGRLRDADADVASAAAIALGHVGNAPAAKALEQSLAGSPTAGRGSIAEGCILCAEKSLASDDRAEAVRLYDLVRKANVPKPRVLEATRGAILARQSAGVPLLVEQLRSPDKSLLGVGLRVARELPGRETTDALVAELGRAAADRQPLLAMALADRGDAAALPSLVQAAAAGPDRGRIAAIRVLGRLGDASCLPSLLDAAMSPNVELSDAATAALAQLPGKDVDADLVARLAAAQGKTRLLVIHLAGQRRIAAAAKALVTAADDPDGQVRVAAITALGETIELGDLPLLLARANNPKTPDEAKAAVDALRAACPRMADREACAGLLSGAMLQSPVAVKCSLVEILGVMGGAKALAAVGAAARDADPKLQDIGSRLLGEWMNPDAAPVLLDLAKTAKDEKYKTRALRGYIRIARQFDLPRQRRLVMCREAMDLAQRDDERILVLVVLARIPSPESLKMAVAGLSSPGLKSEAAKSAVTIASKLPPADRAAVVDAMNKVIESNVGGDAAKQAKAILGPVAP
jgi:HEAT repeat protein